MFPLLNKKINVILAAVLFFTCALNLEAQKEYTTFRYNDGKISSEGYMVDGKPDGYWKTYHPNGKIKSEGNRKYFELDSLWIFYNENGVRVSEITYRNGLRNGIHRIFKDGVVYEQSIFENDQKIGESITYFPTGEIKKRVPFEDGKEHGEGYEYDRNGQIITILSFKEGFLRSAEKVNRYDASGKKRGPWISFHSNGVLASEGTYMNDKKNGVFKTYDRDGDLLSLEKYREGELVTDSEEAIILDLRNTYYDNGAVKSTGGYVDGVKEGTHRIYDRDGNIKGGELYSKGDKIGEGIIDENGDYQGLWKLYYPSGELQAEGEFENTRRIGDWTYYHRNGKIEHKAKFVDGLPHGKWLWYYESGALRREEFFRRGKEDGTVTEYNEQGKVMVKGDYVNGLKDGEWFLNVGDHLEKGAYVDGERTGLWIYEYQDGTLNYEGEYVSGMATGKHRWYHPNGELMMEGKYNSGVRTGTWKIYDADGVEELNIRYRSGREVKINGKSVPEEESYSL